MCLGVALVMGYFVVPEYAPTVRLLSGSGQEGMFVAERLECSKRCLWHGRFRPDTGRNVRRNVWVEGAGEDELAEGRAVRAVDTGSRETVFTLERDPNWLGLIGGSLLVLLLSYGGCRLLGAAVRALRNGPGARGAVS
jgi:hypothetical protein